MDTLAQVAHALQAVLTTTADVAARETRFVQRQSKLTGSAFVQTLVFGFLANPHATLEALTQTAAACGTPISPQGFDQRFTPAAAACVQHVLHAALTEVIAADPVAIPIFQRFRAVLIQDTTTITLPDALGALWQGCGGSTPQGTSAALKLGLRLDLLTGRLDRLVLAHGRTHDQAVGLHHGDWSAGALRLADLGFFNLDELTQVTQQGGWWLSRFRTGTTIADQHGQRQDLAPWLDSRGVDRLDVPVLVGRARLPARLIAVRVPQEIADLRRHRLRHAARRKGQMVSAAALAVAGWTILLTNVPAAQLTLEEALILARVRWQIELVFKLWKSHGRIDESRSRKPWRILCEVYAKILAMVIQHWLLLTSCWQYPNRSLTKAAQTIQGHALHLACTLPCPTRLHHTLAVIQRCIAVGCRINKRKGQPHTYQLLLALDDPGLP